MLVTPQLTSAYHKVRRDLLWQRKSESYWAGHLSSSALSTATAVSALSIAAKQGDQTAGDDQLIDAGIGWLAGQQNADGGWGDTDLSYSNVATTMLVQAAMHLGRRTGTHADRLQRAQSYLDRAGGTEALRERYGRDKTFAVPILTNCALAGLCPWKDVPALPFELACFPQRYYRWLGLPVVSYAIPALVAVGQARYHHRKPRNPLLRYARRKTCESSLDIVNKMQPESGGFLEAIPLTSFVVMSLASIGHGSHPVVRSGLKFLRASVREDGSWPIDTNLATWNTTLAIQALGIDGKWDSESCLEWLLSCQHQKQHPFTGAAPGGWAWSHLSVRRSRCGRHGWGATGTGELPPAAAAFVRRPISYPQGRAHGTRLASRSAEFRWRVADLLSRMGKAAIRSEWYRFDGPRVTRLGRLGGTLSPARLNPSSAVALPTCDGLSSATAVGYRFGLATKTTRGSKTRCMVPRKCSSRIAT